MKKYWQSLEDYQRIKTNTAYVAEAEPEFSVEGMSPEEKKGGATRRDFLKMLGFTVGGAVIAASCETPVRKAIPFLNQPEEITPGVANFYASTFYDGNDYCSILVKTREGRPIKIEGNELSPISKGGTSARVQASILNLYDNARFKFPIKDGQEIDWDTLDSEISSQLKSINAEGKEIVLLTGTIISPSTRKVIENFKVVYPRTKWISYDAVSYQAIRNAHKQQFGAAIIPSYQIAKAKLIVGFNADFLGNWLSPTEFTKQYSAARRLLKGETNMLRHIQYETTMTVTGGSADNRTPIKASDEKATLLNLYNEIAGMLGKTQFAISKPVVEVHKLAVELLENKGESLVLCGTNDEETQLIVNAINYLLGNYGQTIDLAQNVQLKQGDDMEVAELIERMNAGHVGAILHYNANPVYNYPNAQKYIDGLSKVGLKISFAEAPNETSVLSDYIAPDNNYLESWNDAEPKLGFYSMMQPSIREIFSTRQAQDSLLKWSGSDVSFQDFIEKYWEENLFGKQSKHLTFRAFWNQSVHDGVFQSEETLSSNLSYNEVKLKNSDLKADQTKYELFLYEKMGIGSGNFANNPWLQELPDPINMSTWDNYLCVSTPLAEKLDFKTEDVALINGNFEMPVLVQPGLEKDSVAIAIGYGRTTAGKVGDELGTNVYPFMTMSNGLRKFSGNFVSVDKVAGKTYPLALTQSHHTMEGRSLVRESTLGKFLKDPASGNEQHAIDAEKNTTLYTQPEFTGFQWGMAINLNSCIGCGNCVISCQAENNVAVIGKTEVRNRRIMHWIRIDRYYSEESENPEVFHQPVMCQHCDNAPCENVCPVAATPHSSEGLNQMAYNRCIGTRYCMNNCPYRVRRFNWFEYANNKDFDYNMNTDVGKLVLNPDVVVRSRGVVEKCSLCVQRIQEKKLLAKRENRQLADGEIKTACQASCPADAITFGNLLDPNSEISKINESPRMYHLLEQIHTLPSTSYLTKIRNKKS